MGKILDRINSPSDLRGLTENELKNLAVEIREEMVKVISLNGGHLASSLGVVELTIALHRVFDSPRRRGSFEAAIGSGSNVDNLIRAVAERRQIVRHKADRGTFLLHANQQAGCGIFESGHFALHTGFHHAVAPPRQGIENNNAFALDARRAR